MTSETVEYHLERLSRLSSARANWETLWQDVVDYIMPWKADVIGDHVRGARKTDKIYDSTPTLSLSFLSAGLMSHLTSQASPWFSLATRDPELMQAHAVKGWLQEVVRLMLTAFNTSNFGTAIHEFYEDLAGFGTGVIFTAEDVRSAVRFYVWPIREIYCCEDARGVIDTVYRKYTATVRQAAQEFGPERLSADTQEKLKESTEAEITILQVVFPREEFNPNLLTPENMPYASLYIEEKAKHLISESGYRENPWHVARWKKNSREIYGRGPGIDAMPDVKTLQEQRKTDLRAGQKIVEPPLWVHESYKGRLRTTPSAINYFRNKDQLAQPMNLVGEVPFGLEMTRDTRERVKEAFFVDVFLMLQRNPVPNRTATEVVEMVQERLMILGPVLGRLHTEALGPLIERVFSIMARGGYFPDPPDILKDQPLDVVYLSPLAKAQKAMEGRSTQDALAYVAPFFQLDQGAADYIDTEEAVKKAWDIFGAPIELLRSNEDVQKIREQRAQQMKIQAMMGAVAQGAEIDKTMAEAGKLKAESD